MISRRKINHGKQNDKSDEGDHWSEDPLELCKCVGAEEHQRRHGEILRVSADPERGYGEAKLKGNGKSVPPLAALKTPLRDGDVEKPDDESYAGHYFLNANNTTAPGIVDADRQPILQRSEVYSGVYGRASISFYAFNSSGSKGIACSLNNLQKIADGEHLGGKASAEEDFATEEDDDFLS